MSDDMRNATQGALALYLNEVQPVDGRVQINVSLNELNVLRGLAAAPAVDRARLINAIDSPTVEALARVWTMRSDKSCSEQIVEILAPLLCRPATPAVGGEELKDSVLGAIARGWCSRANEHKEFDADLASSIFAEVWAEVAAPPPASPLRGREITDAMIQAGAKEIDPYCFKMDEHGSYYGDVRGRREARAFARRIIVAALASASPPEQPAAAPSLSVDQVRQTIADEWGSHLCYRDSFGTRSCSQDTSGLLACRCNDIARAILSTYTLTPMPAADPVAAADKEHADLLRRLAAVPKEEK